MSKNTQEAQKSLKTDAGLDEVINGMADLSLLNSVDAQADKPFFKASELEVGKYYAGETIKLVKTKHGNAFLIKSEDFNMFLPQRYTHIAIQTYVKNRQFCIKDFYGTGAQRTPLFVFAVKE